MVDVAGETAKLDERVELSIGGTLYAGWTSVSVTRSIDALSGSFNLSLAARARTDGEPLPIHAGDACQLLIGGEAVINGYVDTVGPTIDASDHGIMVSGRDRSADLVDGAAIHKPGSWANVKLEAIAAELAKPYGVKVTAKAATGANIRKFALQPGETVGAALERLCRFRGLLMVPNAKGDVEIITPEKGAPAVTLEMGVNIRRASVTHDHSQRFSEYIVKGQAQGDDNRNGKTITQIKGTASDPGVKRYRPMLVIAEEQGDAASLKARAEWEAGVRAGRSVSADIDVLGWRVTAGGKLWAPNLRVRVKCPGEQLPDEQMLVSEVTLAKSDAGTIATVTVNPPGAWQQLAGGEK